MKKSSNTLWLEKKAAENAWRTHYNRLNSKPRFNTAPERRKNQGLWMRWKNAEKRYEAAFAETRLQGQGQRPDV